MKLTKKHIYDALGYKITAPVLERIPLKDKAIPVLFSAYSSTLLFLNKHHVIKKLPHNIAKTHLNIHVGNNSASVCVDDSTPYFQIKQVVIAEIIPKESVSKVKQGVLAFFKKHCDLCFGSDASYIHDAYSGYFDGDSSIGLGFGRVKLSSNLHEYFSSVYFGLNNLSNTFCSLIISVSINEELQNKISSYLAGNVETQSFLSTEDVSLFKFYQAGHGEYSGDFHKKNVFNAIMRDLVWCFSTQLKKSGIPMLLRSHGINPPCIVEATTNIDGNNNQDFFHSIGIYPLSCDYSKSHDSCFAWRSGNYSMPIFVSSSKKHLASCDEVDILDVIPNATSLQICNSIDIYIRKVLPQYMRRLDFCKRIGPFKLQRLLKLKSNVNSDLFHFIRFINEFDTVPFEIEAGKYVHSLPLHSKRSKSSILSRQNQTILKRIERLQRDYNQFVDLLSSVLDFYNAKSNLFLQTVALFVSIVAVFVSLILSAEFRSFCIEIGNQISSLLSSL